MLVQNETGNKKTAEQKIATNRLKNIIFCITAFILFIAAAAWIILFSPRNTGVGINLTAILLMCLLVKLLGLLPLSSVSYMILFSLLTLELFCLRIIHYPILVFFMLIDLVILLVIQTGFRNIKSYYIDISVTSLTAFVMIFLYDWFSTKLRWTYYEFSARYRLDIVTKSAIILIFGLIVLAVFFVTLKFLGKVLNKHLDPLRTLSQKFSGLETYVLICAAITLFSFDIFNFQFSIFRFMHSISSYPYPFLSQFVLIAVTVSYIFLIGKTASIREKMTIAENDKNMIAAYSSDLETTLDNMHEIRHDAKNLFLTMGGFIKRSGDSEMQEFYYHNIVPFMQDTLIKNDLQDKLKILSDDRLKSFLYYKIIEKINAGIDISLEISSPLGINTGSGDIVRILGILIDNAAEEALLARGSVFLKVSEDTSGIGIQIENDIRPETEVRGVIAGTTDKGLGRGSGLLIAKKIISKYDNIILNSYFTDGKFVQSLFIIKNT
ncbi:MAG: GHKL domain-containing protein [Firmicutes bacterium]|nr:GHKL domain-containing protein [Bacillota bacterium]